MPDLSDAVQTAGITAGTVATAGGGWALWQWGPRLAAWWREGRREARDHAERLAALKADQAKQERAEQRELIDKLMGLARESAGGQAAAAAALRELAGQMQAQTTQVTAMAARVESLAGAVETLAEQVGRVVLAPARVP